MVAEKSRFFLSLGGFIMTLITLFYVVGIEHNSNFLSAFLPILGVLSIFGVIVTGAVSVYNYQNLFYEWQKPTQNKVIKAAYEVANFFLWANVALFIFMFIEWNVGLILIPLTSWMYFANILTIILSGWYVIYTNEHNSNIIEEPNKVE